MAATEDDREEREEREEGEEREMDGVVERAGECGGPEKECVKYNGTWGVHGVRAWKNGEVWGHRVSVAPMMSWTDRHYRCMARMLSRRAVLYTEMVCASTIVHNKEPLKWEPRREAWQYEKAEANTERGDRGQLLSTDGVVLQMGGNEPDMLERAAYIAVHQFGYAELNLNVGCPSPRVAGHGCFGAALMLSPNLVASCCLAMRAGAGPDVPITVKCRIGVDEADSYELLRNFVAVVAATGVVHHFIIHARKALLNGIVSPTGNRSIPPLVYPYVTNLVRDFPQLRFTLNGGIASIAFAKDLLTNHGCHGVMVGRAAYKSSWILGGVDEHIYGDAAGTDGNGCVIAAPVTRRTVLQQYMQYADDYVSQLALERGEGGEGGGSGDDDNGDKAPSINKVLQDLFHPLLGLVAGAKGAKKFCRTLDDSLVAARRAAKAAGQGGATKKKNQQATNGAPESSALLNLVPSTCIASAMACIDAAELDEVFQEKHDVVLEEARLQQLKHNAIARKEYEEKEIRKKKKRIEATMQPASPPLCEV